MRSCLRAPLPPLHRAGGRAAAFLLLPFLVLLAIPLLVASTRVPSEPVETIERASVRDAQTFHALTLRFREAVERYPETRRGEASLRRDITNLRRAWKRMEYIVEWAHLGTARRISNAPIPRADMAAPDAFEVLEPEGLQVLLEVAHTDAPLRPEGREHLRWLAGRLVEAADELINVTREATLEDRMVLEAVQDQILRVMTLGITGFDAPATELALPESRLSLSAARKGLEPWMPELRTRDRGLARRLSNAFTHADRMLAVAKDFDSFDRLAFIREAGNPLYAALVDAHVALDIATYEDVYPLFQRPVNPAARNLFAPNFLNPHAYSLTQGDRPNSAAIHLGRRLFFDPGLSKTGMSCATCHDPRKAFSDGREKSLASDGGTLARNAPGLSHAAFQTAQFWDLRIRTLEEQVEHVVVDKREFGTQYVDILKRLRTHSDYPALFREAFGGSPEDADPISVNTLNKALAQYVRSLARWNSPFDRYVRGEKEPFDPAVRRGFNLFMGKAACATCHFPPTFNGTLPALYAETESEVLGSVVRFPAAKPELTDDLGRNMFHFNPIFIGAFKTPSLRNVGVTAPYMHNGGMATLEDVMEFYNVGGGAGLGLDVPYQTLPSDSLGLTQHEIRDIIVFMESLTDTTGYWNQGLFETE